MFFYPCFSAPLLRNYEVVINGSQQRLEKVEREKQPQNHRKKTNKKVSSTYFLSQNLLSLLPLAVACCLRLTGGFSGDSLHQGGLHSLRLHQRSIEQTHKQTTNKNPSKLKELDLYNNPKHTQNQPKPCRKNTEQPLLS